MRKETIGGLYLAAGFALAGSAPTVGMTLSAKLGPFTITALSLAFALPVFAPFIFKGAWPKKGELATTAALGLFGIVLYRFCLVSALPIIGAGGAGLLTGAAPALTAIASWTFLGERLTRRSFIGIAVASAGVFLVHLGVVGLEPQAGPGVLVGGQAPWTRGKGFGALLALGAAASEATFAVLSRRAWTKEGPSDSRTRTAFTIAWALVFSALPAAAERPAAALAGLGPRGWLALAWYGLLVTATSYVCWNEGIKRVEASRAAAYTGIVPVVSLVLPVLALGERPTAFGIVGCALVALGIVATGSRKSVEARHR
jgi:drug/metabolite transporter (DMT)-like permease